MMSRSLRFSIAAAGSYSFGARGAIEVFDGEFELP